MTVALTVSIKLISFNIYCLVSPSDWERDTIMYWSLFWLDVYSLQNAVGRSMRFAAVITPWKWTGHINDEQWSVSGFACVVYVYVL